MLSIDTNILFYSISESSPYHPRAFGFLSEYSSENQVMLSEFVLAELYTLVRNPAVCEKPLSSHEAVDLIQAYRSHPHWSIVGFPNNSSAFHRRFWDMLRQAEGGRRKIYDIRIALSLQMFGVTHFATANEKDFRDLGFEKIINPLT